MVCNEAERVSGNSGDPICAHARAHVEGNQQRSAVPTPYISSNNIEISEGYGRNEKRNAGGTEDLRAFRSKPAIDIEELLQWAVARSGKLPWMRDNWRALTLNPYTVQPRRRPITSWTLAVACAGQRLRVGAGRPAMMMPGSDGERVLAAIAGLGDPALCEMVRVCARRRIRPDWKEGVEPVRRPRAGYPRRRNGARRGRPVVRLVWEPCSPDQIRAARAAYSRWHRALTSLAETLQSELSEWQINGFAAPAAPWEPPVAKTS